MLKVISLSAIAALALAVTATSQPAFAGGNGGAVAAGVVGGLAVGAIIGSQVNRPYYGGPGYYERSGYRGGYEECHTVRHRYIGHDGYWHVRRVRVCD
jgi:hypothetical protein